MNSLRTFVAGAELPAAAHRSRFHARPSVWAELSGTSTHSLRSSGRRLPLSQSPHFGPHSSHFIMFHQLLHSLCAPSGVSHNDSVAQNRTGARSTSASGSQAFRHRLSTNTTSADLVLHELLQRSEAAQPLPIHARAASQRLLSAFLRLPRRAQIRTTVLPATPFSFTMPCFVNARMHPVFKRCAAYRPSIMRGRKPDRGSWARADLK